MFYVTVSPSPYDYGRDFLLWIRAHKCEQIRNGEFRFRFDTEQERATFVKLYRSSKWMPYRFEASHEIIDEWYENSFPEVEKL